MQNIFKIVCRCNSAHLNVVVVISDKNYKKPMRPCPFCDKKQSVLRRHLRKVHSAEPDVVLALSYPEKSKERNEAFA